MALAHKMTRECFALVSEEARKQMSYAKLFRAALIDYHKEYKAMQKDEAIALFEADTIAKFEKRVAELQAIKETPLAKKWIVTCGNDHPMPINFDAPNQSWPWANVETCSTWNSPQFARANASKVRNGKGELGQAILMADHIEWDIANLQTLINGMKTV